MTFNNINTPTKCDCLKGFKEDNELVFIRRVGDTNSIKDRDFRAKYQKNGYALSHTECQDICGDYNLSMEVCNNESEPHIRKKHLLTVSIGQKLKNHMCKFKLKKDAGMIKYTPNQKVEFNPYHYDFYKDDNFDVEKLDVLEMIPIQ